MILCRASLMAQTFKKVLAHAGIGSTCGQDNPLEENTSPSTPVFLLKSMKSLVDYSQIVTKIWTFRSDLAQQ